MMRVVQDASVTDFLSSAGTLLYQDEPTNSLLLGLCGNIARAKETPKQAPLLLRIENNGRTLTAAVQTPPMNLVLANADREQIEFLARYLKDVGSEFPGVVGPAETSEAFAKIWSGIACKMSTLGMGQKIYKIEKVIIPNALGELRLASEHDVDLVAQWLVEFGNESLPPPERKPFEERRPHAVRAIENELAYVWVVDQLPVSMAHIGRPTQNGISVSAVYTPRPLRKKGYASAVVAHLSQKMLDSGKKFCVLYTDSSNPTSNKIYQEVGYQEVTESKHFLFEDTHV
jgi:uncharacterized protein